MTQLDNKSVPYRERRWKTTYDSCYKIDNPESFKPPIKYHTAPSIYAPGKNFVDAHKFLPGYIPKLMYCRPPGHAGKNAPQALGLGTFNKIPLESNVIMKPISRGVPPRKYRKDYFENLPENNDSKFMYHSLRMKDEREFDDSRKVLENIYSTNKERPLLESALVMAEKPKPSTVLMEPRKLNVKFKPARYNEKAEPWQRFGAVWDRVQLRNATEADHGDTKVKRCPEKPPKSLVPLVEHSGKRQIPGYAGYVPRLPIIKDASRIDNPNKIPTTKGTYCSYDGEYAKARSQQRLRDPVMSNLITLVHPHNPFRLLKGESSGNFR